MLAPRYLCSRWLWTIPAALAGVAVYVIWVRHHSEGMTGGSTPGLWFGLLGFGCMGWTFAMLPCRRRREKNGKASGPRSIWLRGHLWIALLGTVFILCHTGFCQGGTRLGGRLESVLMLVFFLTLLTGFAGLGLQHFLPRGFLKDGPHEVPLCQLPHLCRNSVRQADDLADAIGEHLAGSATSKNEFTRLYLEQVLPFLRDPWPVRTPLFETENGPIFSLENVLELRDRKRQKVQLDGLRALCQDRDRLLRQQWRHWKLHGWLLVHVPLAIVLLFLGLVHAFVSMYF